MKKKILILLTDPCSTTEIIILKSLNFLKKKNNYILIGDINLFKKLSKKIHIINNLKDFKKKKINFYNINQKYESYREYISILTSISIKILKSKKAFAIINMPLNKKNLEKNFQGYTEYFSHKINQLGKENMLLFSDDFSVCPLTTHVQLKKVSKLITKKIIIKTINNINNFYKRIIKKKVFIKVCGLNPHAGKDFFGKKIEEKKIIIPTLKTMIKINRNVSGPYSADTVFSKCKNSAIIGMYHDQVLPTFKALKNYKAINITIGLKYLRLTPNHGTGLDILTNKKINIDSFKYCIKFCEKYLNV